MTVFAEVRSLDDIDVRAARVWRWPDGRESLSSAPVGGGWRRVDWLLNVGVDAGYARTDLDAHADEVAARLDLSGPGQVLLTAADVTMGVRAESGGVHVDATVGITKPTWAADTDDAYSERIDGTWTAVTNGVSARPRRAPEPGTINIVVQMPVALTPAAAVNAVITATEAKTQALLGADVPGTGTASDAVTVLWPTQGDAEAFAGPRSTWGARLARAVHDAMLAGIEVHP